ncbi:Rpn family recombination-promoting nuclease/putative transposase [Lonepinella sp. BR2474]|uniref:Rpn family recombination-promoting nuclease/putative transposase n=1 Tax=Lonepinella sp. BR2474 TaxID=3434548 RepID=UPI003F6E0AB7
MKPSRYIDLTTDYGFKRIFGTEPNKDLLISFLNELFKSKKVIKDLTYNKNEQVGDTLSQGAVIFDLICTADDDSQFIIEVQRSAQENFKARTLYYGSKLISDQAPKGERSGWRYAISEVYVIVIMDRFRFSNTDDYLHDICLCNRKTGEIFYDRLGFIYVELLNFHKKEEQLETDLERWLFVLKNMTKLDKLSPYLRKPIFEKLFNIAEYANFSKEEKNMYDVSLKRKWDEEAVMDYAVKQGVRQGELKNAKENAVKMLSRGFDVQTISEITDLSVEEIKNLLN